MPDQLTLYASLVVAGIGSVLLVVLASAALFRRRSLSYFLITMAIGTLALRSFLGAVTVAGYLSLRSHHVLEHVLDALVIGLLFAAVYAVRTIRPDPQREEARDRDIQ